MINIAIFASGGGSNSEIIIKHLPKLLQEKNTVAKVALILTNNANAGVLKIALANNIPTAILNLKDKTDDEVNETYFTFLKQHNITFIVLAGYLKKIPTAVINAYPQKIINIHPALLPAYGGAGMYGMHVHDAVVAANETQSGITIHFVDEVYDHGKIIFQATCLLEEGETGTSLAKKVLALEHENYSNVISYIISNFL
ncbi:MAG: phosphoribosylglycinamide formyltransferase [Ferruginibacter sp.]|nr:phosphoribosylglycinamide formyltransferase [Ferruginibacter sp.]